MGSAYSCSISFAFSLERTRRGVDSLSTPAQFEVSGLELCTSGRCASTSGTSVLDDLKFISLFCLVALFLSPCRRFHRFLVLPTSRCYRGGACLCSNARTTEQSGRPRQSAQSQQTCAESVNQDPEGRVALSVRDKETKAFKEPALSAISVCAGSFRVLLGAVTFPKAQLCVVCL